MADTHAVIGKRHEEFLQWLELEEFIGQDIYKAELYWNESVGYWVFEIDFHEKGDSDGGDSRRGLSS